MICTENCNQSDVINVFATTYLQILWTYVIRRGETVLFPDTRRTSPGIFWKNIVVKYGVSGAPNHTISMRFALVGNEKNADAT